MKKMIIPMLAVLLAFGASAFSYLPVAANSQTYDWQVYQNGVPTSTFLQDLTEQQVRQDNPECDGNQIVCFRAHDENGAPLEIYIRKD